MIGFEKVASVYAEALLLASVEAGAAADLEAEFKQLEELFHSEGDVWAFFKSPIIDEEKKVELLTKTLKGKIGDTLYAFLCILCQRRRFELFPEILEELKGLMDEHFKSKRVHVLTAVPLSDEQTTQLKTELTQKLKSEVVLEVEEKPEILGGLVIRTGDLKEDSSIKDSLARIHKSLSGKRILGEKYYA